jgi:hypothetical protein
VAGSRVVTRVKIVGHQGNDKLKEYSRTSEEVQPGFGSCAEHAAHAETATSAIW